MSYSQPTSSTSTHASSSATYHVSPAFHGLDVGKLYRPHGPYTSSHVQRLEPVGISLKFYKDPARTSSIRRGLLGNLPFTYLTTSWNSWHGFLVEMGFLSHPRYLRPLQGICVPLVIGVFRSLQGLLDVVTELPNIKRWRTAHSSLPISDKLSILKAYKLIHKQGVRHGSVALRNMLIDDDGKATIIDFKRAACSDTCAYPGFETCRSHELDLELRKVKFLLDLNGARANEYHLAQYTTHGGRVRPFSRDYSSSGDPFYIPENTLRRWEDAAKEDENSSTHFDVPEEYRFVPSQRSAHSTPLPLAPYPDKSLTETEQGYLLQVVGACPPSPCEYVSFSNTASPEPRASSPVVSEGEVSAMMVLDSTFTPPHSPTRPTEPTSPLSRHFPSSKSLGKRVRSYPSSEDELPGQTVPHPKRRHLLDDIPDDGMNALGYDYRTQKTAEYVRRQRKALQQERSSTKGGSRAPDSVPHLDDPSPFTHWSETGFSSSPINTFSDNQSARARPSKHSRASHSPLSSPMPLSRHFRASRRRRYEKELVSGSSEEMPSLSAGSGCSDSSEDILKTPLDGFPFIGPYPPSGRHCVASYPIVVESYESDMGHRNFISAAGASPAHHPLEDVSLSPGTAEPSNLYGPRTIVFINESYQGRAYRVAKDIQVITEAYIRSRPPPPRSTASSAGKSRQRKRGSAEMVENDAQETGSKQARSV